MLTEKKVKYWHLGQTTAQLIILAAINAIYVYDIKHWLLLLLLSIYELTLLLPERGRCRRFMQLNHYLASCAALYTLPTILYELDYMVDDGHFINTTVWLLLVMLYSLIMFIPVARLGLGKIQNNWGRLAMLTFPVFQFVVRAPEKISAGLHYARPFKVLVNSGLIGTVAFILVTLVMMRGWRYRFLHFAVSKRASLAVIALIILVMLGKLALDIWPALVSWPNVSDAVSYYAAQLNWAALLTASEAGIAEEWLARFCTLSLLLAILENTKHRLLWLVLLDGLVFAAFHLPNLRVQSLAATLWQMVLAAGFGFFTAAVYLYTGSLIIPMVFHGLHDLIGFVITGATLAVPGTIEHAPTAADWQLALIQLLVAAIFALYLVTGSRKRGVVENLHQPLT